MSSYANDHENHVASLAAKAARASAKEAEEEEELLFAAECARVETEEAHRIVIPCLRPAASHTESQKGACEPASLAAQVARASAKAEEKDDELLFAAECARAETEFAHRISCPRPVAPHTQSQKGAWVPPWQPSEGGRPDDERRQQQLQDLKDKFEQEKQSFERKRKIHFEDQQTLLRRERELEEREEKEKVGRLKMESEAREKVCQQERKRQRTQQPQRVNEDVVRVYIVSKFFTCFPGRAAMEHFSAQLSRAHWIGPE